MTCCLDVETFIREVEKYPEIWDLTSEDHRFKNRKRHAWSEIARVFIDDFENMNEIEKLDLYRKLHSKWRNIRDSYVRHTKNKYGKKGYMYAKQLSFLDKFYKRNSQSGSDVEPDNNDTAWQSDDETKLNKLSLKKRLDTKSNSSWLSEEETPSTIENLKRKRRNSNKDCGIEFVEAAFPEATCSYSVEDEDRSFFESLLPAVRRFDMDQKLEFRSEVIRLIKTIRRNTERKFKLDLTVPGYDE